MNKFADESAKKIVGAGTFLPAREENDKQGKLLYSRRKAKSTFAPVVLRQKEQAKPDTFWQKKHVGNVHRSTLVSTVPTHKQQKYR